MSFPHPSVSTPCRNDSGDTIVGLGSTSAVIQNGIEVGYGAAAQVVNNTISGNIFAPQSAVA
jgi:hypothetical protein